MKDRSLLKKVNKLNEMVFDLNLKKGETVEIELSKNSTSEKTYNRVELKHFSKEIEDGIKIIIYHNNLSDFKGNNINEIFDYLKELKNRGI